GRQPRLGARRASRRAGAYGRHGAAGARARRERAGRRRAAPEDHRRAAHDDALRARHGMTAEEIAWRVWTAATPSDRALRSALVPAAIAYSAGMAVRNRLYDAGWLAVRRVPARVVSVGSITVGGAGKTPAALWLA